MRRFFVKALATLLVGLFVISGFNFSILASNAADLGEKLVASNIELRGKILLMLYFKNADNVEYFKVGIPQADGTTTTIKIDRSKLVYDEEKDRHLLKIPVAAAQQTDVITFQAFDANGNAGKIRTYSVKRYAEQLFAMADANPTNEAYAAAVKAVKSMLNYGAMVQAYFGHNKSNLANAGLYYRGTNPINGMSGDDIYGIVPSESVVGGNGSIQFTSVNAYLEDTVSLRFYFTYTGTEQDRPEQLVVQVDDKTYTQGEVFCDELGHYYVLVNNIPATCVNKLYRVRVSEQSGTNYAEIKYSVMNYLQAKLEQPHDQKLENIVYSMFQFYAWVSEYVQPSSVIPSPSSCSHDRTYITADSQLIICSDCGATQGTAENVGAFEVDGSGNVTTLEGFSYKVNGQFETDPELGFLDIQKDNKLTITSDYFAANTSTNTNRFHMHYYASAPAKITLNYSYGANGEKTASEYYYLEAGENTFSAVEWSFLASKGNGTAQDKISYYGENRNFKLASITVEPLTDTVDFVLFDYDSETLDTSSASMPSSVYNGGVNCFVKHIENDRYKLGINLTWGGAITEWYDKKASDRNITATTNLVNACDAGRLIQQSYYGSFGNGDGYQTHYWSSNPGTLPYAEWHYNPVQGGDANNNQSRIIDFEIGNGYIYVKAQPRDWANHVSNGDGTYTQVESRYTECYIENRYTLTNDYIQVFNRMVDFSGYTHPSSTQELPAFYTLAYFDDYYWYSGDQPWVGELTREDNLPFWGDTNNASRTTFNYQTGNTETWGAYINEATGYGVGMYVPNTDIFKGGRTDGSESNKVADAKSGYTSYFAPMKELQIICYEPIEYSYLLCAGTVNDIRATFSANKDFEGNKSLDNNSISQKLPADTDITSIDFSKEENLVFFDAVNDAILSYDSDKGAAKFVVTGNDSHFLIDYTSCRDFDSTTYSTSTYSCIEFEYMIPADSSKYPGGAATGQELFYQVGSNVSPSGDRWVNGFVTLVADGKWHTAKYYTSSIGANWSGNINSLRIDFLNNALGAGQTFYIKSFSITKSTVNSVTETLGTAFSGQELIGQLTDGYWDLPGAIASSSVYDGDFVRVVVGDVIDRYVGFNLDGTVESGKYMVIKYRTDSLPTSMHCEVFAAAGENTINTLIEAGVKFQGTAYGIVGDGKWHTLVIDLSKMSDDVSANGTVKLNEVRIDLLDCFEPGTVVDIAYVGFCNNISKAKSVLENGEYLELALRDWGLSVDYVQMNDATAIKNSAELRLGAAQTDAPILEGSVWEYGGWFAINEVSTDSVAYCITEEDGTENWVSAKVSGTAPNRWFAAESGVISAAAGRGFSNPEDSRRLYLQADLRKYAGQTVTISIRAITSDGYAVILYYVKVRVTSPEYSSLDYVFAGDDLYSQMFGGAHDSITTNSNNAVRKNADGTVSVTVTERIMGSGNSATVMKWIGFEPRSLTATGNYMVVKYRTSAIPKNGQIYIYCASGGDSISSEANRMTSGNLIGDGKWHTLVIDLSEALAVNVSGDYKYHISDIRFQMLDQLATGAVVDFAYVGFCNSLKDVPNEDGALVDYGWQRWLTSVDKSTIDGNQVYGEFSYEAGANMETVLNGTKWTLSGWTAIDGKSISSIDICVTDETGAEHHTEASRSEGHAENAWWKANDITSHVTTVMKPSYSESTIGYRLNLNADLSNFYNQTVNLSVRATTSDGMVVTVYSAYVNVPLSASPGYFSGAEIEKAVRTTQYTTNTSNGYLTITKNSTTYDYGGTIDLRALTSDSFRYAVIKYKTTVNANVNLYATTVDNAGNALAYEPARHITPAADNFWHVAVVDLKSATQYIPGNDLALFRLDIMGNASYSGQSFAIDYIWFTDDITGVTGSLAIEQFRNNVDFLFVNGDRNNNLINNATITGKSVQYTGWLAVNDCAITSVSYAITDAQGNETVIPCNWNLNRGDITDHVQNGSGFTANTVGCGGDMSADLSAWAGQTVVFSVRATTNAGYTAETFSVVVNVPAS